MRRPAKATRPKPRVSNLFSYAAPVKGWIANEGLANPTEGGAAVLVNWFPKATTLSVRGGTERYATLGLGDQPVTAIWSYLNGSNEVLFASTEDTIYDISEIASAYNAFLVEDDGAALATDTGDVFGWGSTSGHEVMTGLTGGDWIVVQFATAGGVFSVGVNGASDGFTFDGEHFLPLANAAVSTLDFDAETADFVVGETVTGGTSGATGEVVKVIDNGTTGTLFLKGVTGAFADNETITGSLGGGALANGADSPFQGAITGVDVSDLSFVWPYKGRLWFVEKESLDAWYLAVDQITGAATKFPLGGVFLRGGSLLFGATWSLDSGESGGLSEQCIFVSTEGEVAVYQGTDPGSASTWSKVGVYRIGRPLGHKAFTRAGADIVIATDIGLIPLSQALQRDFAALSPAAVSYPIETAWNERVALRGGRPWQCEIWPTQQMYIVALPTIEGGRPEMLVANARTGAWALYTGWDGTCVEVFKERCFFGTPGGAVIEAGVTGADEGLSYTATCIPLFNDMNTPGSVKLAGQARAVLLSPFDVLEQITMQTDFEIDPPPPPDALSEPPGSLWGSGIWGQSKWGDRPAKRSHQVWRSVAGAGATMAPCVQITSGSVALPDIDLVRVDVTSQSGDLAT